MSEILTPDEYRREMDECTDTCIHEGNFDMKLLAHDAALRLSLARETEARKAAERERDEWRRHAEEQLADVLRLRFLGIEFASLALRAAVRGDAAGKGEVNG